MAKKYFPGANTGRGFFSRFDGIVPPGTEHHYTYILKGGPGVGKNTMMKRVRDRALKKGYEVEEFCCASDPDSLDAVRVPALGIALLDGTSPHNIDPKLPGITEEIFDLGRFKNRGEFAYLKKEAEKLFAKNSSHYRVAYALLSAAYTLKKEALSAAANAVDTEKLKSYLMGKIRSAKEGGTRELFARSATPKGTADFSGTFLPENSLKLSGIVGDIALLEAKKLLAGKEAEILYDFIIPEQPYSIIIGEQAISKGEGGDDLHEMLLCQLSPHVEEFCIECEKLCAAANAALSKSLLAHDEIEKLYRPYVDYDRNLEECEKLFLRLGL